MAGHLRLLAAIAGLTGCGSVPASINPVAWWHDLQGGVIAEQRPPPPGATDPYPNIASVPERPAPLDPAIRQSINQVARLRFEHLLNRRIVRKEERGLQ